MILKYVAICTKPTQKEWFQHKIKGQIWTCGALKPI